MNRLKNSYQGFLPYILIFCVIVGRLLTIRPYNFIPIFSCLLFFGAVRPKQEFNVPLLALIGVDVFLTTHRYGYALTTDQALTWGWYLMAIFLGTAMLRNMISTMRVIGASLTASISYFVASNFAVWAAWGMYPKTSSGLVACYIAALPFFRNSVATEIVSSLIIFILWKHLQALVPARLAQVTCS
jgi:hypothetical protein